MTIDTPATLSTTHLVVFDFDETIVNCNSDFFVNRLSANGEVLKELLDKFSDEQDWTDYMQQIFKFFATQGVKESDYRKCLKSMPLVEGMKELFEMLKEGLPEHRFEVIIISDANTFFINQALEVHDLKDLVRYVLIVFSIKQFNNYLDFFAGKSSLTQLILMPRMVVSRSSRIMPRTGVLGLRVICAKDTY